MQLRTKVILFLAFFVILLVGVATYYLKYTVQQSFTRQTEGNLRTTAKINEGAYAAFTEGLKSRALEWSTDTNVRRLAEILLSASATETEKKNASTEFSRYFRETLIPNTPSVLIVDIVNSNGLVVASTREKRLGVDEREEEVKNNAHHFSKSLKGRRGEALLKAAVFEDDESEQGMSHVTTHLFSDAQDSAGNYKPLPGVFLVHFVALKSLTEVWSGELQARQKIKSLQDATDDVPTPDVYLVNEASQLATLPNFSASAALLGKSVTTKPVDACFKEGRSISGEYANYRGALVLGISVCIPDEGVVILNEIEASAAYALMGSLIQKTVIGSLVLLVLLIGVSVVVSRDPLRNLTMVIQAAEAVSRGDLSKRVLVEGEDEIGSLGKAFNSMLDTISSAQVKFKESEEHLKKEALELAADAKEHAEESKFREQSKRATQNLLEDAWESKERLEVERNRLQAILASIADGLILIDHQYKIILVNPKASELLSLSSAELLGQDLRTMMQLRRKKKGDLLPAEWPIEEMFMTRHVVVTDLEDNLSLLTSKRTIELPITLSVAPLATNDGSIGGVIVIRDVTHDRELDEAKSGFISVASHQLRTPLTTIRWYSEMLLADDAGVLSADQRDFLSEIHGGAERLYQTIDLLLGISRVESGKMKTEKKAINLTLFTEELMKELAPLINEKHIAFTTFPPAGDPIIVHLDSLTFRQVILNLFSNAIRYTNDNSGTIEARWTTNEAKTEVTYTVKDNGIGIPQSQRGRIFSKFFRAENALSKAPDGSGLGLALVKELVIAWGGKVWFETTEGQGTTFFFTVPLGESAPQPVAEGSASAGTGSNPTPVAQPAPVVAPSQPVVQTEPVPTVQPIADAAPAQPAPENQTPQTPVGEVAPAPQVAENKGDGNISA